MWKHPLTWIGLFLLTALVAIWDYSPEDLLRPTPEEAQSRFPQAFMTASETRHYDADGKLQYQTLSERADHFQQLPNHSSPRDYSLIQAPDVTVFGEDPSPWRLTARLGRSDAAGEILIFTGEVRAWQQSANGTTEITTPELEVEPNRQFAQTDKAVTMRSPQGRHDAVGMRADLAKDHIELLSEVRGTYEPRQGN